MGKVTGVIERWNPGRGFGFLKPEDGGEEVFFHASEFKGEERDIRNGDTFEFEVEYDKRKGSTKTNLKSFFREIMSNLSLVYASK